MLLGEAAPASTPAAAPFQVPARLTAAPRLTERVPALYPWAVRLHRARRRTRWITDQAAGRLTFARSHDTAPLPVRVKKHASLLLRELDADQMHLQHAKVTNLRLAAERVDGIVIRPGETFSFNQVVGNCTRRKGYVEGMRLSNGAAHAGVGGGICQLANLIHWMVLHSPLTVVERSEHSFDPFPDTKRVLPWGVGCSIVYSYVDLTFRNDTDLTFQILVGVGERYLEGELRASGATESSYKVEARDEVFLRHQGRIFRRNEIWRRVIDKRTGQQTGEELLKKNCALVIYEPAADRVIIDVA